MPAKYTYADIQEARQHQQPRRLEMQIPAPAILVRQRVSISGGNQISRSRDRYLEKRLGVDVADLAPIKPRMRHHNFQARHQQRQKRNGSEPMSDAHPQRVSKLGRFRHRSELIDGAYAGRAGVPNMRTCAAACFSSLVFVDRIVVLALTPRMPALTLEFVALPRRVMNRFAMTAMAAVSCGISSRLLFGLGHGQT